MCGQYVKCWRLDDNEGRDTTRKQTNRPSPPPHPTATGHDICKGMDQGVCFFFFLCFCQWEDDGCGVLQLTSCRSYKNPETIKLLLANLQSCLVSWCFSLATYYKNSIRRFRRNARDDITRELIKNTVRINLRIITDTYSLFCLKVGKEWDSNHKYHNFFTTSII